MERSQSVQTPVEKHRALSSIAGILAKSKGTIGIGSPRASLESLESLLRARRLDRTLAPRHAHPATADEYAVAATGVTTLDARLGGGFPRGELSELVGPRSSGRTSLALRTLAAATARGELTAVVDALDMADPASVEAAGVDGSRLLWVRGHATVTPGFCRDTNQRALEQAIKALTLIVQAGNFGVVVFDAAGARPASLRQLPFTTWMRLQRIIDGTQTVCLVMAEAPLARSAGGVTLQLGAGAARFGRRLFDGVDMEARVIRARDPNHVRVPLSTAAGSR